MPEAIDGLRLGLEVVPGGAAAEEVLSQLLLDRLVHPEVAGADLEAVGAEPAVAPNDHAPAIILFERLGDVLLNGPQRQH